VKNKTFTLSLESKKVNKGALAISSILVLGAVVFEVSAAAFLISYLASQGGLGTKILTAVNFAAFSGINDALRRIIHNDFSSSTSYNLNISSIPVQITVCKNLTYLGGTSCGTPSLTDRYEVVSLATFLNKNKKYKARVYLHPLSGQVILESIEEITAQ